MRRFLRWSLGTAFVLVLATVAAFKLSPWPSVALITFAFAKGDDVSAAALARHVPPGIVEHRDVAYGAGPDERLDIYTPGRSAAPRPTIVWVHGGGFIAGSKDAVGNYLKILSGQGYITVAVEYSTGYGSKYPTPVAQVNAALAYLFDHATDFGIDTARIILAGDSAGAQIASQVALLTTDSTYARQLGIPPLVDPRSIAALVLVSGAFDLTSLDLHGEFGWFVRTVLWAYSGQKDFSSDARFQLLSITPHVSAAFPPSFITSGNGDPLARQAVALARRLTELGVPVDTLFFPAEHVPALPHEYQFNLDDPSGVLALRRTLTFLDTVRKAPAGPPPSP